MWDVYVWYHVRIGTLHVVMTADVWRRLTNESSVPADGSCVRCDCWRREGPHQCPTEQEVHRHPHFWFSQWIPSPTVALEESETLNMNQSEAVSP